MRTEISNTPSTDNLIVGNCVSCDGMVRIPIDANPYATVRCPRCHVEFKLIDVLEQAAPVLEVVDGPTENPKAPPKARFVPIIDETPPQPDGRQKGDKFVVSPILQKNAKRKRRRRHRSSSEDGSSKTKNATAINGSTSQAAVADIAPVVVQSAPKRPRPQTDEVRRPPRPARKKNRSDAIASSSDSSGGLEITKIILGAMLAIPVAQLLIWWFAGTDPLNVGPTVSRFAPFVVPSEFQPDVQKEKDELFNNNGKITDLKDLDLTK